MGKGLRRVWLVIALCVFVFPFIFGTEHSAIFIFGIMFVFAFAFVLKAIQPDKKPITEKSESKKFNVPKINLPKFKDSGWVLFYVICGWINFVLMNVFFVQEESTFAFVMLGSSLSCFFAAHVLRLQEKVAFHAEQQTNHAQQQTDHAQQQTDHSKFQSIHAERQTELLEKLSSEKSPIIEDKEK